jgi:hypothetical protein
MDFIFSDSLDIKADTFEGYTIQHNQISLMLCEVNDLKVDPALPVNDFKVDPSFVCSIKGLIDKARMHNYYDDSGDEVKRRVELVIAVQCAEKVDRPQVQDSTVARFKIPLEDSYSKIFPEQRRVAQRLLERVRHVMRMPENGGSALQSFSLSDSFAQVRFLILVPVFTTLKVQTAERVTECNLARFKPEWEEHVLMYDMSSKGKFDKFKNQVLNPQNKGHLFVIIADDSHWGYTWGEAHDTFVNDSDLLEAKNLIIMQVSATPYCNLTRHSRVPEKYIEDVAAEGELKILDPEKARSSENYSQLEELHVVKW